MENYNKGKTIISIYRKTFNQLSKFRLKNITVNIYSKLGSNKFVKANDQKSGASGIGTWEPDKL